MEITVPVYHNYMYVCLLTGKSNPLVNLNLNLKRKWRKASLKQINNVTSHLSYTEILKYVYSFSKDVFTVFW